MQTEIQSPNAIRAGSILLEVGPNLSSLVNLGALRDVSFEQQGENANIEFDNAEGISKYYNKRTFQLNATLAEIDWDNLAIINANEVTVVNENGDPVSGEEQVVDADTYDLDKTIELEGQNADGSAPTINSVTGSVDGALAAADYDLVKQSNGRYALVLNSGAGVTTTDQTITVDYDYTPSATKVVTINDSGTREKQVMRITNTNEAGKTLVVVVEGVANVAPISIDFAGDNEAEVATLPISLEGKVLRVEDSQAV